MHLIVLQALVSTFTSYAGYFVTRHNQRKDILRPKASLNMKVKDHSWYIHDVTSDVSTSTKVCVPRLTKSKQPKRRNLTSVKTFNCSNCDYKCNSSENLKKHERIHTGAKPYICFVCEKKFSQSSHLKRHAKTHTGVDNPFSCYDCDMKFNRADVLKRHLRIHTGEKPYSCSKCEKKFAQVGNLREHEKMHDNSFSCSQCDKIFTQWKNLKVHEMTHTMDKLPFKCLHCGEQFLFECRLIRHERIHTGEKAFQCSDCDAKFTLAHHLKRHKQIHAGEKTVHLLKL